MVSLTMSLDSIIFVIIAKLSSLGFGFKVEPYAPEVEKYYQYGYQVEDYYTGDYHGHMEHTAGQLTKGEYKVKLPDGRVQVVSYEADHAGFRPRITYEKSGLVVETVHTGHPDHADHGSPHHPAHKPHQQQYVKPVKKTKPKKYKPILKIPHMKPEEEYSQSHSAVLMPILPTPIPTAYSPTQSHKLLHLPKPTFAPEHKPIQPHLDQHQYHDPAKAPLASLQAIHNERRKHHDSSLVHHQLASGHHVSNYHPVPEHYQQQPEHVSSPDLYQPPPDQYQPPPNQYQPPPDHYQPPPEHYQPPPEHHQPPPDHYHPPPEHYQSPPAHYESPVPDLYQPPALQQHIPALVHQHLPEERSSIQEPKAKRPLPTPYHEMTFTTPRPVSLHITQTSPHPNYETPLLIENRPAMKQVAYTNTHPIPSPTPKHSSPTPPPVPNPHHHTHQVAQHHQLAPHLPVNQAIEYPQPAPVLVHKADPKPFPSHHQHVNQFLHTARIDTGEPSSLTQYTTSSQTPPNIVSTPSPFIASTPTPIIASTPSPIIASTPSSMHKASTPLPNYIASTKTPFAGSTAAPHILPYPNSSHTNQPSTDVSVDGYEEPMFIYKLAPNPKYVPKPGAPAPTPQVHQPRSLNHQSPEDGDPSLYPYLYVLSSYLPQTQHSLVVAKSPN